MPAETITSRANPIVTTFRAARRGEGRRHHLLLDGHRLIADAHRAGVEIEVVLVARDRLEGDARHRALADALTRDGIRVATVSPSVLNAASPSRTPGGAVALARHPHPTVDDVLDELPRGLVVAPVAVQDAGNMGSLVRAAEAGGARGVAACEASADPFGWRALRGAMGSTFRLPVATAAHAADVVATARRAGARVVATVPRGGVPLGDAPLTGAVLALIGGEGEGLDTSVEALADVRLTIPMQAPVESLNAAVAAALVVYESRRQTEASSRTTDATRTEP